MQNEVALVSNVLIDDSINAMPGEVGNLTSVWALAGAEGWWQMRLTAAYGLGAQASALARGRRT